MKFQYGQTVKLTKFLYIPQAVKNILRVSRLTSKGATMGATKDKIIIKENVFSVILDASKGQNKIMMFFLKAKRYAP